MRPLRFLYIAALRSQESQHSHHLFLAVSVCKLILTRLVLSRILSVCIFFFFPPACSFQLFSHFGVFISIKNSWLYFSPFAAPLTHTHTSVMSWPSAEGMVVIALLGSTWLASKSGWFWCQAGGLVSSSGFCAHHSSWINHEDLHILKRDFFFFNETN